MQSHSALSDPNTVALIERKVAALARSWNPSRIDADDIRQEIYLDLVERLPQHDPAKSRIDLFIAACIHRKIYNLVRGMLAQRRSPVRDSTDGFDARYAPGTSIDSEGNTHAGERERRLRDLRIDLAELLPDLTVCERKLLQELQSDTMSVISRRPGRTPNKTYAVFRSLRQKLRLRGLDRYVVA